MKASFASTLLLSCMAGNVLAAAVAKKPPTQRGEEVCFLRGEEPCPEIPDHEIKYEGEKCQPRIRKGCINTRDKQLANIIKAAEKKKPGLLGKVSCPMSPPNKMHNCLSERAKKIVDDEIKE
ncbi:hypothetical protein GQ602_005245 [Ophiocordyceps camponoti-floridani]|uniref:Uncharacterized protein n=1 Tax=Ophiocordyceps camponoti-floridani TaxID=2030778 RepID=A0A8H4Q5U6_9HYPO|nr:hypothetical protein GQ602_005245 [Ophiocordyceps camponoti-floridani]